MISLPRLLIVAGHDPSGAGIDADRASLRGVAVEPLFVVTAFTEQDECGVRTIGAREPSEWLEEALACASPAVAAVKFGLLPGASHVRAACALVRAVRASRVTRIQIVVDPVITASSGSRFLDEDGVDALRRELIAESVVLTPNLSEAAELANLPLAELVASLDARIEAAHELQALGALAVILKGGHGREDPVHDLVVDEHGHIGWHTHPRIRDGKIRGSGCRFASRLAAGLAQGATLEASAHEAGLAVAAAIGAG